MIGYLKGKITHKSPTYVYIECSGVGYHVNISLHTFGKLDKVEEATLLTYMHIVDNDMSLYGFFDEDERHLFTLLLSVSGVGANTARLLLSSMEVDEIKAAIISENDGHLSKVKGIGPKTAKRIILDLKDKLIKSGSDSTLVLPAVSHTVKEDSLSALVSLGIARNIAEKYIQQILKTNPSIDRVEDLIKLVLKHMN